MHAVFHRRSQRFIDSPRGMELEDEDIKKVGKYALHETACECENAINYINFPNA